jgi:Flp pilus assembly protein TadD
VRHIDIVPTILQLANIARPAELLGHSLLEVNADADSYFEALSAMLNRGWAPLVGMIHGPHKYIDLPMAELYDLKSDPAEKTNLAERDRRALFAIRDLLTKAAPAAKQAGARNVSNEEKSNLASLGYLTGTSSKTSFTIEDDPKKLVDVDNDLHRVVELYQSGRIREAVTLAQQVTKQRPGMSSAYEMLGFLLQESERPDDAIAMLRAAIASGTATEHMRMRLGLTLSESGRAKEAVEVLAPFAAKSTDPDILNAYGIALADSGNPGQAFDQFRRALSIDATNAKAYQNFGIIALRSGDTEDARQHLLRALQLNDRMPIALNALGVIYARERKFDDAVRAWSRAVELDPQQYDALYNVALVNGNQGRWPETIAALDRFIATAPPQRYAADIAKSRAMREEARRRMNGTR